MLQEYAHKASRRRSHIRGRGEGHLRRNSKKGKHVKKPDKFVVGQRVLTQKFTSGNAKRDRSFTIPAKVLSIRPNTEERSAVLELADGEQQSEIESTAV